MMRFLWLAAWLALTVPAFALSNEGIPSESAAGAAAGADLFPTSQSSSANATKQTLTAIQTFLSTTPCTPLALTPGATPAVALNSTCNNFTDALAQNQTLANPSGATVGEVISFVFSQPPSGGTYNYTIAFNTDYLNAAGGQFTTTSNTGISAKTVIGCQVIASTPTLVCYGPLNGAYTQTTFTTPTAPNSTSTVKMQGMAGTCTPTVSGNILIFAEGTVVQTAGTAATIGINWQLSYGTGGAPGTNGALAGTQVGPVFVSQNGATYTAGDPHYAFYSQYIVSSLTVGTAYWIDLAAESIGTASDTAFQNGIIGCVELH